MGAGATRGAFHGTFSPRISPPLNTDYFNILSKFVKTSDGKKDINAYKRLVAFIEDEVGTKGIEYPTMEQVFNVLFISKDLPQIFHKGRGRKRGVGFRQEVRDFLTLLVKVFRFIQEHGKPRDNLKHYELLTKILRSDDVVVSLNYDTMIDNALVNAGWNPQRGYSFSVNVKYGDITRPKQFAIELRNVHLIKPHGSFNWFAKGSFAKLETVLEKRPVSQIKISKLPSLYESRAKKLVRFFIPPLYTKFFKNKFWNKLWVQTYKAARNADRVVIIGCSLITTDFHLRAILSKALTDKKGHYKEIIIVDPSENVKKRLKKFYRGRSASGVKVYSTFTEFCKKAL